MNGIIAALFVLMMFILTGIGMEFERADTLGYRPFLYPNPPIIYVEPEAADRVYELIANDPEGFVDWLYEHYYVLDARLWERIDEDTYIKK